MDVTARSTDTPNDFLLDIATAAACRAREWETRSCSTFGVRCPYVGLSPDDLVLGVLSLAFLSPGS